MKGIIIVVEFSIFMVLRFIFIFLFVCLVVIFLFVIYCLLGGIFDGVYFIFMEFVLLFKEVFWVVWLEWFWVDIGYVFFVKFLVCFGLEFVFFFSKGLEFWFLVFFVFGYVIIVCIFVKNFVFYYVSLDLLVLFVLVLDLYWEKI